MRAQPGSLRSLPWIPGPARRDPAPWSRRPSWRRAPRRASPSRDRRRRPHHTATPRPFGRREYPDRTPAAFGYLAAEFVPEHGGSVAAHEVRITDRRHRVEQFARMVLGMQVRSTNAATQDVEQELARGGHGCHQVDHRQGALHAADGSHRVDLRGALMSSRLRFSTPFA